MAPLKSGTLKLLLTKTDKNTGQGRAPALAKKWEALRFSVREGATGDTYVLKKIFAHNAYHRIYRKFRRPQGDSLDGLRILDLGANIGAFTRRAMEEGARVVAVEMDPSNFSLLTKNTTKRVVGRPAAVAATRLRCAVVAKSAGSVQAFTKPEGRAASSNPNRNSLLQDGVNPSPSPGRVRTVALRQLLESHGPFQLIKMDIEGYEVELFAQLARQKRLFAGCEVLVYFHADKFPRVVVFASFVACLRGLFGVVELEGGVVGTRGMLDADWEERVRAEPGLEFRRLPGIAGKKRDILLYCGHTA